MTGLATTLQAFFTDRLVRQRQVSTNTIQAYRDTLRLLLVFASERQGKSPVRLDIDDLDAPLIGAFLDHLERERQNGVRTRNARLAAIRSLFRYAALRHPEHAATIERVLAIPPKRFERRLVTWLTEAEIDALLAAPDRATWTGRRDTALFSLAAQTGLRASELDRADPCRCSTRSRCACQLHRQRAKAAHHAAHIRHHRGPEGLACRAGGTAWRPAIPDTDGTRP
jgi:integrase/recombinase XerD